MRTVFFDNFNNKKIRVIVFIQERDKVSNHIKVEMRGSIWRILEIKTDRQIFLAGKMN